MRVQLLNGKAPVHKGDRLVTFGSEKGKPFVPGVPVGKVVAVDPSGGNLTKTLQVQPYVGFTRLDIVGVVVVGPRTDPRDGVLPPKPPTPPPPKKAPATPAFPATPASPGAPTSPGTPTGGSTLPPAGATTTPNSGSRD
jgi:rod shape-determining protein MreC